MKNLPVFKYCPDPIKSEIFKTDQIVECECCGEEVDVYYDGPIYTEEDFEYFCPNCIHSGKAKEELDAEFQQDLINDENVVNEEYKKEVMFRTPGYHSWQGNQWPAHCDDYCAFIAYVGWQEIENMGIGDKIDTLDVDINHLQKYMQNNGSLQGYLFKCLKCGQFVVYSDCD